MLQNLNLLDVDWIQGISVTFTGIVIVFSMLVLLVFILFLFGKIFAAKPKTEKVKEPKAPAVKKATKAVAPAVSAPVPKSNDEIIAVIAAAVASMYEGTGVKPIIRRIKKSGNNARPAWTAAGIFENTRSF